MQGVCLVFGVFMADIDPATTYTKKTAAIRLGLNMHQVNRLIKEGYLSYTRPGRKEFVITEAAIRACEDTCPTGAPPLSKTPGKGHPWRVSSLGANSQLKFSEWELSAMAAELNRYRRERVFTPRRYWLQATIASYMASQK